MEIIYLGEIIFFATSSPDQCCWVVTSPSNLMQDVLIPKIWCENHTALNIYPFEDYNFTYSSRQVASKHGAKIYCIFLLSGADSFHIFPSLSASYFIKGRQRGFLPAFRCTNKTCLQVLNFYSSLFLFILFTIPQWLLNA